MSDQSSSNQENQPLLQQNKQQTKQESLKDLKPHVRPLASAFFISIVAGLNDGSLGTIIPRLKAYYSISNETISLLFLCSALGFFISAGLNGYIVHKIGQLNTFYFGATLMLISFIILSMGFPFPVMACTMPFVGAGMAVLDAGMNVYTANVPLATLMLNVLHALYGVGAMISPLVASLLLKHNISWKGMYIFLTTVGILNIAMITFGFWKVNLDEIKEETVDEQQDGAKVNHKEITKMAIFNRVTLISAAYILVYVGVEVTLGGWGYTWLKEGRHGDSIAMANVVSGYWAGLASGRILLGYLSSRFGEKLMIILFTIMIIGGLFIMTISSNVLLDSTGLLLGPMFPTTISLASKALPRSYHATSIGFMAALGAGGAALFPFLTGQVAVAYKTIIDALSEDEKFQTLLDHIKKFQLETFVNNLESGTLFAPDNEAFQKCQFDIDHSAILYHLLKKGLMIDNMYNGQLKETMYVRPGYLGSDSNAGQRIKFTKDGKKTFVNEAKIIEKDIQVNNQTIIQVIDRVLQPPMSLGDSIIDRNKAVFDLMNSTDIIDLLRERRPFTVIVSKKENPLEVFNAIEASYLGSKYGKDDLSLFFKYAIIDKPIYIDEFNSGKTTYKSLSGDSLVIVADKDKKSITVNDIPIVQTDIIAANGVIHEIDDTFKFDGIEFNTRKYLYGSNGTHMVELFDKYDSSHYIDQKELNYTFLIPPADRLNQSLVSKSWLRYHVAQGSWPQENLIDGMLLQSQLKSSDLDGNYQRLPVYVEKENKMSISSRSVQFGKARVIGDSINIHDDIIYQTSDPLLLPGDILEKLVVDLDLSTFLATLYASGVADEIKNTRGLTLFVPTNEAFQNLGLVAKYLVHSSAKSDLQTVLRYHAARSLLYYDDIKSEVHEVATLANSTLRVSQNQSGSIIIGRPEGNGMNENAATVTHANTLVSNGVVHKISQVQIPNQVSISNQHLLVGIEANTMTQILTRANLLGKINQDNMVILAPSDKAFAHVDLDALFADQYQLERVAKLHIIPTAWQDQWILSSENNKNRRDKSEYSTLLSDDDKVAIRENENGELFVEVKNGGDNNRAHATGLGRVSAGGGVIAIDTVLLPIRRGLFGLPIVWSIVVLLTIIIITGGILSIVGFFGYKVYSRRRLGYRPIFD
ncbi:hypothetical protein [Parasitella parasitica]|uniref:FAS1 domain-containing protein n=1 Tax=Parasitella parasitica TaxID=35722 RepID=A0A0B7N235_9FUNG|nr:hypothetical protein [Parasitella parasitica]